MSSTYAIQQMNHYFNSLEKSKYYYKECAINARSPENEADPYEKTFLEELQKNPKLVTRSEIRTLNGQPFFVIMRRGEQMEESCLRCHSTPDRAPGNLVKGYGPTRSFGRQVGEQIQAISIRIPLAAAYEQANHLSWQLSGMLLALLGGLFASQAWISKRWLFDPMAAIRHKALEIADSEARLGETIPVPAGQELRELTTALNTMSLSLRQSHDYLEERVRQRTADLNHLNERLEQDISLRKQTEESLREATETFQALIQASPLAIFVLNPDGRVQLWNEAAERIFGWTAEEAVGQVLPIVPEEKMPEFRGLLQRALDGESLYGVEARRRTKDGTLVDIRAYTVTLYDPQGRITGIMATVDDITLQKQAEEVLRKSEERYRTVADYTYDMEYWVDQQRQVLYMSPACERLTGYTAQAFIDDPPLLDRIVHPEDRARFINHREEAFSNSQVYDLDFRLMHRNGSEFWVNHNCQPVYGADGSSLGRRISNRDITIRKRAEAAFQSVVSHAPMGIFIIQEGKFVMVNPGFATIGGYSAEEVLGQDSRSLVPLESREIVREKAVQQLKGTDRSPFEFQFITKSGETRWGMETIALTQYEGKRAIFGYFMDITARKKLEAQFLQAQKMEAVGRLAGGVAHDFNNMLSIIIGHAEVVLMGLRPADPLYSHLEGIRKASDRSAALTRQLLAFSRKQIMQPRVINLNDLVTDLENMLCRLMGADVELATVFDQAPTAVKADPGQVEQIILNLAVNARDAMPLGGKLTIETKNVTLDETYCQAHSYVTPGPYVMLAMSDNGLGMDANTQAHLFEPFFTTKEPDKGTGLGLSTVYGIVKQSGGSIEVYSELGYGTTIKIYLAKVEEPAASTQTAILAGSMQGSETILVVEDEDMLRPLIIDVLKGYGYKTLEARDGDGALRLCEQHQGPIHLMLTDVVMPRMTGRELADRLAPLHPEMKVLFMSGYNENAIVHHGVLDKDTAFIQKPFSPDDLARKVREVLDTSQNGS